MDDIIEAIALAEEGVEVDEEDEDEADEVVEVDAVGAVGVGVCGLGGGRLSTNLLLRLCLSLCLTLSDASRNTLNI